METVGLKRYLPRSLYARAALILILPIVVLQIVVSVVFVQRHYADVTEQMSRSVAGELQLLLRDIADAPDAASAATRAARLAEMLNFSVDLPAPPGLATEPQGDRRRAWDLPGRIMIETLRDRVPGVLSVDLITDHRAVTILLATEAGPAAIEMARRQVSATAPHQLLVYLISTGILLMAVSYLFLRNQLRPIKRLADAAEAFGKGRHALYRPSGAREVRAAGMAFLDMRARIERQIEQRTMMLSGVSHDLRTPLTRMRLALSMMEAHEECGEEAAEMARDVADMQRLVDEFLAFARGDALDDPVPVDAAALVRDLVAHAARAGQKVNAQTIDETGRMPMRPLAVTRALENLIGNAVRHGTSAWVSVQKLDRSVRFRVEDDGDGIPPEARGLALKPFSRLNPARTVEKGSGVGLGLAIAADIARKHGGTLVLGESERFGGLRADFVIAR